MGPPGSSNICDAIRASERRSSRGRSKLQFVEADRGSRSRSDDISRERTATDPKIRRAQFTRSIALRSVYSFEILPKVSLDKCRKGASFRSFPPTLCASVPSRCTPLLNTSSLQFEKFSVQSKFPPRLGNLVATLSIRRAPCTLHRVRERVRCIRAARAEFDA